MTCATHIIECLKDRGINPHAFTSSEYGEEYVAANGINYQEGEYSSRAEGKPQWWAVDFKKEVSINSYQISSGSSIDWISGWTLFVSYDNKTWILADAPAYQYPGTKIFELNRTMNARFVRINGGCPLAQSNYDKTTIAFWYIKFFGSFNLVKQQRTKDACATKYRRISYINKNILFSILVFSR